MDAIPPGIEFGALPRNSTYGDGTFPRYEDRPSLKLLPRDVWQPVSMSEYVKTIYSQLDGMCTSNGTCSCMMADRAFRGRSKVVLSPEHLYGQHSKWGTGSTLGENLRKAINPGVCSRKTIPPSDWHPSVWPSDWKNEAANYQVAEWIDLNADFDAVATALQMFRPCLIGVTWPSGGGHAIAATELAKDGRDWVVRGPNSWGENWGDNGFYTLTERQCDDFGQYGCWAIGATTEAKGDT
jgi:hypothetical protein